MNSSCITRAARSRPCLLSTSTASCRPSTRSARTLRPSRLHAAASSTEQFSTGSAGAADYGVVDYVELNNGLVDFYKLLRVPEDASGADLKKAYRAMQKVCHPDILGEERGHRVCIALNEAYRVLSNSLTRELYNVDLRESIWEQEHGFVNVPRSEWLPDTAPKRSCHHNPGETRAIFVDETICIGCKACVWQAPATFKLETIHGRAQVYQQWGNDEGDLEAALGSCPVDCIHWVERADLPILEHVVEKLPRISVGIMQANTSPMKDVFEVAKAFKRHEAEREKAHSSWSKAWQKEQEQDSAMAKASSAFAGRNIPIFGKLMLLIKQLFDMGTAKPRAQASQAPVPRHRALVRVPNDEQPRRRRGAY